ncbi:MAG: DUF6600 domain-containing protein [Thermodesulfobacteriota bacterium]
MKSGIFKSICCLALTTWLCLLPVLPVSAQDQSAQPVVVGRISYIAGELLRYVPEQNDWVATVEDAPFGLSDILYSGDNTRAESIFPNGAWIRMGDGTQVQLIAVGEEFTRVDLVQGMARFYNQSADGVIEVTSAFGRVTAPGQTIFDFYAGDKSVEVIALKGTVTYTPVSGTGGYDVTANGPSIIADGSQVTSGDGKADEDWDAFNSQRDRVWADRISQSDTSMRYLPPRLHEEAYVLEEYGQWDRVYYEGAYHHFWRPVRVTSGWAPFTHGHWTVWYDDNCWIPHEPFGYITHHYGSWVHLGHHWYWVPPKSGRHMGTGPGFAMEYAWYPGRVAWIYSGTTVGWIPLTPLEPYYCHRYWGPRCNAGAHRWRYYTGSHAYRYRHHAVIINRNSFYRTADYSKLRLTQGPGIDEFKTAPVLNNRVIPNYSTIASKYNFTKTVVNQKPHESVTRKIRPATQGVPPSVQQIDNSKRPGTMPAIKKTPVPAPRVTEQPAATPGPSPSPRQPRWDHNRQIQAPAGQNHLQPGVTTPTPQQPQSLPTSPRHYRKKAETPAPAPRITEQPAVTTGTPPSNQPPRNRKNQIQKSSSQGSPQPGVDASIQPQTQSQPSSPKHYRKTSETPATTPPVAEQPAVTSGTPPQPSNQQRRKQTKPVQAPAEQKIMPPVQTPAGKAMSPPEAQVTTPPDPPPQTNTSGQQRKKGKHKQNQQPQVQPSSDQGQVQDTEEEAP